MRRFRYCHFVSEEITTLTRLTEDRILNCHLIKEAYYQHRSRPRLRDGGVADISARITETLERFEAQLRAAWPLQALRANKGRASFPLHGASREFGESKPPTNALGPASADERSVI
jgi:hypothetical protein